MIPGGGACGNGISEIEKKRNSVKIISNYFKLNKPIVGICLGM